MITHSPSNIALSVLTVLAIVFDWPWRDGPFTPPAEHAPCCTTT